MKSCRSGFTLIACLSLWLSAGCDPAPAPEEFYFDESSTDLNRQIIRTEAEWNSVDGAIQMVQMTDAPDADFEGNTQQWIDAQRALIEGDIMFPRWEGKRKGANRFEVMYTHTVIDHEYNIVKSGYRWEVDTRIKSVEGPHTIETEDLQPPPRPEIPQLEPLWGEDEDITLE
jgi:hypothetical protein